MAQPALLSRLAAQVTKAALGQRPLHHPWDASITCLPLPRSLPAAVLAMGQPVPPLATAKAGTNITVQASTLRGVGRGLAAPVLCDALGRARLMLWRG